MSDGSGSELGNGRRPGPPVPAVTVTVPDAPAVAGSDDVLSDVLPDEPPPVADDVLPDEPPPAGAWPLAVARLAAPAALVVAAVLVLRRRRARG